MSQFNLLWKRRFAPLFSTQFCSAISDSLFKNALVIFIVYSSSFHVEQPGILSVLAQTLMIIPFFLFSALAGQLADKFKKSQLIIAIKAFEVLFMCIVAYAFLKTNLPLLFVALFLAGCHSAFFGPVKYSILPEALRKDELIAGNALIEASTFLAILLGVIIGTQATLLGEGMIGFSLVAIAAAGLVSAFFIPVEDEADSNLKINFNLVKETFSIIKQTRQYDSVFQSILGISWFWLIGGTFLAQIPAFTRETLGAGPGVVQLFLCAFSIGIGIGSLLCNRLLKGQINAKYVPLGVLGMSVFIFDISYNATITPLPNGEQLTGLLTYLKQPSSYRMLFDMVMLTICGGLYVVPLYALMQHDSPKEFRSQAVACNNIMGALFMCAAAAVTIALLAIGFSITQVFFIAGILNTIVAIYICRLLPEVLVKSFVNWILQAFYKVKVHGLENYYDAGDRVLIIANHTSYLDIVLLSAFLPQRLTYVINKDVASKWWIKPFLALVEAFPVDPTNPMTTKSIIKKIKAGKKCLVFPEGRITTTGTVMKVYEGPGLIAQKSGATILPIRIEGAQFTLFSRMNGKFRIRLFPKIAIHVLKPRKFELPQNANSRESRGALATQLYKLMVQMLFESSDYHQTVFRSLLDAREISGGRCVVMEDINRQELNYNQVIARCYILGKALAGMTQIKERVGVMMPTSNAGMITFFALQAYGRTPAMINFSSGLQNILSATRSAVIKTILTSRRFVTNAKLENLCEDLQQAGIQVVYLEDVGATINIFSKVAGLVKGRLASALYKKIERQVQPTDAAVVLFTSGSEGNPKGVLLSHENLLANCYQITASVDFSQADVMFNALPIFHCFGLTAGAILPLISGIKAFYYPSPLHYRIVPELVYDVNATMMFGTDTFLSGYSNYAHPYDFHSIRYIFAGAEKLKPETAHLFMEKFGVRVFEGYGATETAPVLAVNTPILNKPGSVGCLLPSIEAKLTSVPGIEGAGRLCVKGPNVMLGYLRQDKPGIIEAPQDGWYDTGDIVAMDPDGFISIRGRAKRFAKIGGEMVSLTAVECHASKLWPQSLHAVINIPDAKKGESLVLLTNREDANRADFVQYVKQQGVAELYIPKKIIITNNFPVLATGKVDYKTAETVVSGELEAG